MNSAVRRYLPALAALLLLGQPYRAAAQEIGIVNGIPYRMSLGDTVTSPYLPQFTAEPAGLHGFVQVDGEGGFTFGDGTPARFFGVVIQATACFPDSINAIATAARLRKLGVNLVRFDYMDYSYFWTQAASFLDVAAGARSIHEGQMRKFDWFLYQLKKNGIYSYLSLQSARAATAEDGLGTLADSLLWIGQGFNYLYPQARSAQKGISKLLLDHVNPFTGSAYKDEPAIAMLEIWRQGGLLPLARANYIYHRPDAYSFSWNHSRRLDTLYSAFLGKKYGSSAGVAEAWADKAPQGGYPNRIREGSFEGPFELHWEIESYDGTSLTPVLSQDSVSNGKYAMTLRTRNSQGSLTGSFMAQQMELGFDTVYQLIFRSKSSNPEGRDLRIYGAETGTEGLQAGLDQTIRVQPYWTTDTVTFVVPIRTKEPVRIGFYFGDADGEISFDDIRLRPIQPVGLVQGESVENSSVGRIPWSNAAAYLVSSRRVQDQNEFYMALDGEYFTDMKSYVADSIGAKQPITGAGHYWASSLMDVASQSRMDFGTTDVGWDGVSSDGGKFHINNYSILGLYYYTPAVYEVAARTLDKQPMIAAFSQTNPNRYQAEGMLYLPAYSSLQDWDGLLWSYYLDNLEGYATEHTDSASWNQMSKNPSVISMMPAASHLFRNGLISPAETTVRLRHSREQLRVLQRMEQFWGAFGVPGTLNGYGMAISRIAVDSLDADEPTQASDFGFPPQSDATVISDNREIQWNVAGRALTVNTPKAQGASGFLGRSDNVMLDNLEIDLVSGNETSTFLWVPLKNDRKLSDPGRSFLVVASRSEPTGMRWSDTSSTDTWGTGPMLIEPVRANLTFRFDEAVSDVSLLPLNESGLPAGSPIAAKRTGNLFTVNLDTRETKAMWYSVLAGNTTAAPQTPGTEEVALAIYPNVASDRAVARVTIPGDRDRVTVELYDAIGAHVATLHQGSASGKNDYGIDCHDLPSGTYRLLVRTERGETAESLLHVTR